jgi:ABC-2 type transport system ATP-binding protein
MIQASGLTKRYGDRLAVEEVSFRLEPGRVTGFLGPNGAGKSTTMRLMLGLDAPSAGRVTVNGRTYRELRAPLWEVGALLDARAVHGGRTARDHLGWLARSNRIPGSRVEEVLELVGLAGIAGRRVKAFSRGMSQRLGIAAALLGDPGVLILDEPVNGLDTEGIAWIRALLRRLAGEGRTVLVSSHLMSEMQLTADHLLVLGQGRLLADTTMAGFIQRNARPSTLVRSPHWERLRPLLEAGAARVEGDGQGRWRVLGLDSAAIGDVAARHRIQLHELSPQHPSLEELYLRLTGSSVDHRSGPSRTPGWPDQERRSSRWP